MPNPSKQNTYYELSRTNGAALFEETCRETIEDHYSKTLRYITDHELESLSDAEVLDILLAKFIQRSSKETFGERLIEAFASIRGVLAARKSAIRRVSGATDEVVHFLKFLDGVINRLARSRMVIGEQISSTCDLHDYCRSAIGHLSHEQVRILFLDNKLRLIEDAVIANGTINTVQIFPREIVKQCLAFNAAAIILVHNHPSGDVRPGERDRIVTDQLRYSCASIDVDLLDHIIVSQTDSFSFLDHRMLCEQNLHRGMPAHLQKNYGNG